MEFKELILEHVKKIKKLSDENLIEEQTKMYMIAPFLSTMGYDVFNPEDVIAEFTADIGEKKGEKVDYALKINGEIEILIEAKAKNDTLDKHDLQLKRYFNVTNSKIGILTNGIIYKFFTDLEKPNVMDNKPFLIVDLFDITDEKIKELKKFTKSSYDTSLIMSSVETMKYSNGIKIFLNKQLEEPDEALIRLIGKEIYTGKITQSKIEELSLIFKETFKNFINDSARKKLESVLESSNEKIENIETSTESDDIENKKEIITTEKELECFYIIKSILRKTVESNRIFYRDNLSYFNILLDNTIRKWICRLYVSDDKIRIVFPNSNDKKVDLEDVEQLYNFEEKLIDITNSLK